LDCIPPHPDSCRSGGLSDAGHFWGKRLEHWRRTAGSAAVQTIDLGNEPPLGLDGNVEEPINRRRVSIRWLVATVLVALSGAGLMGGAVYAALDGEYRFAIAPEIVRIVTRPAGDRSAAVIRKADRITLLAEHFSSKQVLRVSTTTRVGEREIVRVRPFVRVAGNLALAPSALSASIPPFNPVKLMAEAGTERVDEAPQIEPTGELTIVMRDLAMISPAVRIAAVIRNEEVLLKVREAIEEATGGVDKVASLSREGLGARLAYAAEPRFGFEEMRIIPENMSTVGKTANETTGGVSGNERTVVVKKGEGLTSILREMGAAPAMTRALIAAFSKRARDGGLKEGQRVRVLIGINDGETIPLRVSLFGEQHEGTVALSDLGRYVMVEEPRAIDVAKVAPEEDEDDDGRGMRLYQSIYETALKNEMPQPVIDGIVRMFSFDVDLQRRVRPGDSFEVLYAGDELEGASDVLFASLVVGSEPRRYYRFQTTDDSIVDYYDETGKSAKKFLVRKPMAGGIFRSGFGMRRHPVLKFAKMHTGVDWADDTGTPIFSAGNGTVIKAEWDSGYGRRIEIQHLNGYVTAYSHMSGFARGVQEGVKVRQGQVIGYVGNSGLSTGPHLHYEVLVNGHFVDPMRIKLPRGRVLETTMLADFEAERARIDGILERVPGAPRLAHSAAN
jgi:murein DD-endopeptidase MepM/ murein hydrolase activator NlpD